VLFQPKAVFIGVSLLATAVAGGDMPKPGGDELQHLMPHIQAACAVVRERPSLWPVRSFPYGPLGLQVRKAPAAEADGIRNFHLGLVAAACGVRSEEVTGYFFCGPECPKNRRDHLVQQLAKVRILLSSFERLRGIRLISIWAPKGELRVNDVFVLNNQVREAVPSAKLGLVPSGDWRPWPDLPAYLATLRVEEATVTDLVSRMRDIGLSALVREPSYTRAVGVGVGDNESGLVFMQQGAGAPRVGKATSDATQYTIVEEVAPGVFYYETT